MPICPECGKDVSHVTPVKIRTSSVENWCAACVYEYGRDRSERRGGHGRVRNTQ